MISPVKARVMAWLEVCIARGAGVGDDVGVGRTEVSWTTFFSGAQPVARNKVAVKKRRIRFRDMDGILRAILNF
jgi:hypothetical protein